MLFSSVKTEKGETPAEGKSDADRGWLSLYNEAVSADVEAAAISKNQAKKIDEWP